MFPPSEEAGTIAKFGTAQRNNSLLTKSQFYFVFPIG